MLSIWLSIAPIFGTIILGQFLRRGSIPSPDFWDVIDRLVYWVLLPSLLFYKMSTAHFDAALVGWYSAVIVGSFSIAVVFGLVVIGLASTPGPIASSVLQGIARHNTFIALAIAERLYGAPGLELAILAAAILIPVTNLSIVPLVIVLASGKAATSMFPTIVRDVIRNPLILSVGLGVAVNLLWGAEIPVVHDMTLILGGAALPIMLLNVGASLKLREMSAAYTSILLACTGKLIVFPLAVLVLAQWVGLNEMQTVVAMLLGAAPTATSSYTLARQLGGDAPLMAAIMTIETALAFVTLPVTIRLVMSWV